MVEPLDVGWLKRIDFDTRTETNYTLRVALRVDTNATPALASDDAWFVSADFLRRPGTSVFAVPATYSVWRRWLFEMGAAEWAALTFVPGSALAVGETQAALPTNGLVTAFGLFQDLHAYTKNLRVDNVTLYARRVYPPPPPRGTLYLLQ